MKSKLILTVALSIISIAATKSQSFTKILTGPVVTDGSTSFGSSWIDLDQDDDLDLFVGNVYFENDRFYINNGNGTFTQNSSGSIVNDGKYSYNSTWGDYDNDGFEDAFIANGNWNGNNTNTLFHNNGNGTFTQITTGSIVTDAGFGDGSAWADYDNDGKIDLFVSNNLSQSNFLYHNNGNGVFTKITTGAIVTDIASSASGIWGDYDNDKYPDLFVAHFGGPNALYHNNGNGTFTKITTGDIVNDIGDSHGASWGDYDNDGFLDLFVNRWYNENDLLYHNNGNGTFTKITTGPEVNNAGYGTGSSWGDYDNDGWLDLFVCNSSLSSSGQINYLYHNNGNGTFTQVTSGTFPTDLSYARGASWCDYDNDGDLDLHVANEYYSNDFMYQNNGNSNNWINIKCYGIVSNKSAIGTRVSVKAVINGAPVWQTNFVTAQSGYAGQNSLNVEFGLGNASIIDSMIVRWPSGLVCYFTNVPSNQFEKIYENCKNCPDPVAPANITGSITPCANSTGVVYTCTPVSGATYYTWTVPGTATIVSGQGTTSITVNFSAAYKSGTIGVSSRNCAGSSAQKTLNIYGIPATPGAITGPKTGVCAGTNNVAYSIAAVGGSSSYAWTAPANATIISGQGTHAIVVNYNLSFISGTLSVTAVNPCGTSPVKSAFIRSKPPVPSAISGPATFCGNQQGIAYSIASVTGATSYNWLVPAGATVATGQGTSSITVNFGTQSGKVKVSAGNSCGFSGYKFLTVTKTCREAFGETETENTIKAYPNPSSGDFVFEISNAAHEKITVNIYDIAGKLVLSEVVNTPKFTISNTQLVAGIYSAEIIWGENKKVMKLVKTE